MKSGHVLVVDEADKAPTSVTCILKTLVESKEMILSDGRRIVPPSIVIPKDSSGKFIQMHPDFKMMVLANRPGFPFLGNDFFAALGMVLHWMSKITIFDHKHFKQNLKPYILEWLLFD